MTKPTLQDVFQKAFRRDCNWPEANIPMTKTWTDEELTDMVSYIQQQHLPLISYPDTKLGINKMRDFLLYKNLDEAIKDMRTDSPDAHGSNSNTERALAILCDKDYVLTLLNHDWLTSQIAPLIIKYRLECGV